MRLRSKTTPLCWQPILACGARRTQGVTQRGSGRRAGASEDNESIHFSEDSESTYYQWYENYCAGAVSDIGVSMDPSFNGIESMLINGDLNFTPAPTGKSEEVRTD